MVVQATGHQVRRILWEQVPIVKKRVGSLCELQSFVLKISKSMFDVSNMLDKLLSNICQ